MNNPQLPLGLALRDSARFDSFFPGQNREAVASLQAAARGAGESLIYIAAPAGLGKTHLLQAACHAAGECRRTAGYLPLAATLATERIHEGFLGAPGEYRTFFHGHTYTGNPLACAAALASHDAFEQERTLERLQPKIALMHERLTKIEAMPEVTEVRACGFMTGIDLGEHDPALRIGHQVTLEARKRGAIIRPLVDVIVLMPPLSISETDLRRLLDITAESIQAACANAIAAPLAQAA